MNLLHLTKLTLKSSAKPGQPSSLNDPQVLALAEATQQTIEQLERRLDAVERRGNGTGGREHEGAGS